MPGEDADAWQNALDDNFQPSHDIARRSFDAHESMGVTVAPDREYVTRTFWERECLIAAVGGRVEELKERKFRASLSECK